MKFKNLSSKRQLVARMLEEQGIKPQQADRILPRKDSKPPLSYAQQRLWFLDQFGSGSAVYNISYAIRLKGRLDIPALERSLTEIVRRHEVLRTTFSNQDGSATQMIRPAQQQRFSLVDLSGLRDHQREDTQGLISRLAQQPFDLEQGPLLRAALLRLDDQEHIGVLVLHHIVSDGWSRGVLTRELTALYQAYTSGKPSPLTGTSHTIWRLRGMAARMAPGRSSRKATGLLEEATGGRAAVARTSCRQVETCHSNLPRGHQTTLDKCTGGGEAERVEPPRRYDAVHHIAGCF